MTLNKKEQICNLLKDIETGDPASVSVRFCDSKNIKIIPIGKTEKFVFGVRKSSALSDQLNAAYSLKMTTSLVAVPFQIYLV